MIAFEKKKKLTGLLRVAFFAFVSFYFSYHLISGEKGVVRLTNLEKEVGEAQAEYNEVAAERKVLEERVSKLYAKSLDKDLIDEQARKLIGHAGKNEIMYIPSGK